MSAGRSSATGGRRRRRTPEVAEQEIIDAAEELLRERPFRDLTVDEVMRRTDLSRPSFYVYFRDRHHLVLKVCERLQAESAAGADIWYEAEGTSGREVIREATAGVVAVFERHGAMLQALADAAADDPEVEAAYRGGLEFFIEATARHIEREIEAGNMLPCNAKETARALSIMNQRYLTAVLGRNPTVDPEVVVDTITTIWIRTLYGEPA
jgi:TetR/AcrR family transcriptional regulator, ethionamide resistance regulator